MHLLQLFGYKPSSQASGGSPGLAEIITISRKRTRPIQVKSLTETQSTQVDEQEEPELRSDEGKMGPTTVTESDENQSRSRIEGESFKSSRDEMSMEKEDSREESEV